MGITVKGVEALIGRALKFLRESLSEYLPGNTEAEEKKKKDAEAQRREKKV